VASKELAKWSGAFRGRCTKIVFVDEEDRATNNVNLAMSDSILVAKCSAAKCPSLPVATTRKLVVVSLLYY